MSLPSAPRLLLSQEHADARGYDGPRHAEIYAQYGLTAPKRGCWGYLHAEGAQCNRTGTA